MGWDDITYEQMEEFESRMQRDKKIRDAANGVALAVEAVSLIRDLVDGAANATPQVKDWDDKPFIDV